MEDQPLNPNSTETTQKHMSSAQIIGFTITAVLGGLFFGYTTGVLNNAQDTLNIVFKIQNSKDLDFITGFLSSIMMVGAAVGAFLTGTLLSYIGRRQCLILADMMGIAFSAIFITNNVYACMVARFLVGIVVGINSALVPLYIKEMSPVSISGLTGSFNQTSITIGVVISYSIGLGFKVTPEHPNPYFWRIVLVLPAIFCALRSAILLTCVTFDTPNYLVEKNKMEDALSLLGKIYHPQYVQEQMQVIQEEINKKNATVQSYGLQFSQKYRSRTILGMMSQVFQQLSGINAVVLFSTSIFENIAGKSQSRIFTIYSGIALVVSPMVTGLLLNKFGRKSILLQGEALLIFFCAFLGIMNVVYPDSSKMPHAVQILMVACIIIYNFSFGYTLGPVVWIYCADILSDKGISISTTTNWLTSFVVCLLAPKIIDSIHIQGLFFIFCGCCVLGFIYFSIFLKETKGLNPNQIEKLFDKNLSSENQQLISAASDR